MCLSRFVVCCSFFERCLLSKRERCSTRTQRRNAQQQQQHQHQQRHAARDRRAPSTCCASLHARFCFYTLFVCLLITLTKQKTNCIAARSFNLCKFDFDNNKTTKCDGQLRVLHRAVAGSVRPQAFQSTHVASSLLLLLVFVLVVVVVAVSSIFKIVCSITFPFV